MRVGVALSAYEAQKLSVQKRGRATFRSLARFFEPVIDHALDGITAQIVVDLYYRMAANAPVHADRAIGYGLPFFDWAKQQGLIDPAPDLRFLRPRPQARRDRLLNLEEVRIIWRVAPRLGYPFGPAIQLMALTLAYRDCVGAMRLSELTQGPEQAWTFSPGDRADPDGKFDIPLCEVAVGIVQANLQHRQPGADLVFSATGVTPISGWSRAKRRLDAMIGASGAENASMAPWRLNDLRAAFAAIAQDRLKTPAMVVERCLGRVSGFADPLAREWAFSEAMLSEHRRALTDWSKLLVEG